MGRKWVNPQKCYYCHELIADPSIAMPVFEGDKVRLCHWVCKLKEKNFIVKQMDIEAADRFQKIHREWRNPLAEKAKEIKEQHEKFQRAESLNRVGATFECLTVENGKLKKFEEGDMDEK